MWEAGNENESIRDLRNKWKDTFLGGRDWVGVVFGDTKMYQVPGIYETGSMFLKTENKKCSGLNDRGSPFRPIRFFQFTTKSFFLGYI